jgi:hypothetical protein
MCKVHTGEKKKKDTYTRIMSTATGLPFKDIIRVDSGREEQ